MSAPFGVVVPGRPVLIEWRYVRSLKPAGMGGPSQFTGAFCVLPPCSQLPDGLKFVTEVHTPIEVTDLTFFLLPHCVLPPGSGGESRDPHPSTPLPPESIRT